MNRNTYKGREGRILRWVLYLMIIAQVVVEILLHYWAEQDTIQERIFELLSSLSLAFIASYIFYYIVVVLKERRDSKNINLIISQWIKELIDKGKQLVALLEEAADLPISYDWRKISKLDFDDLCKKANPTKVLQKRLLSFINQQSYPTYGQLVFRNSVQNVNILIEKIFVYMPCLESELTKLLSELKETSHLKQADFLFDKIDNQDFSVFSKNMYKYLQMLKYIAEYSESFIIPSILKTESSTKKQ